MRYCGISEDFHDASIAFIEDDGTVSFAAESERYSKIKNDPQLHKYLCDKIKKSDLVTFYEDTSVRLEYANKFSDVFNDHENRFDRSKSYRYTKKHLHHVSHAAAAFYTRPWVSYDDTVLLTIDGYGEYQTATIMNSNFDLLHEDVYPNSIGVVYAMVTKLLGYKALEEEYIVMGMASFGEPTLLDVVRNAVEEYKSDRQALFNNLSDYALNEPENLAASVQAWAEEEILKLATKARKYGSKLCYSGGVAQNIMANSKINPLFDDMWIAANPTDGGSSIGAAARTWALETGKNKLNWEDNYLGFDQNSNVYPKDVAKWLFERKYCGVINGPAEFGPRALGNRSLLANPIYDIKDTVNKIKRRQPFRPFAPAILEEFADEYFSGPMNEYMQYTANSKHDYKSVTHVDGTARVQIVRKDSRSILRPILEEFYELTRVPMLLNTSLNVRGKPICNDKYDAKLFEVTNGTKVFGS
jgi:carbamoyltransferase